MELVALKWPPSDGRIAFNVGTTLGTPIGRVAPKLPANDGRIRFDATPKASLELGVPNNRPVRNPPLLPGGGLTRTFAIASAVAVAGHMEFCVCIPGRIIGINTGGNMPPGRGFCDCSCVSGGRNILTASTAA